MKKIRGFGEEAEGFSVPVLNEREIRAAAGLLFLLMFIAVTAVLYTGDFQLLKYAILIFLSDMLLRVFLNPRFSPSLILGRLIVSRQTPEFVGAAQKKFAWTIGVIIASVMFTLIIVFNTYSPVTGLLCLVCLVFLFFEAAFGICLGCLFYPLFYRNRMQHCPGQACEKTQNRGTRKIAFSQLLVIAFFTGFLYLAVLLFSADFEKKPKPLFGKPVPSLSKK